MPSDSIPGHPSKDDGEDDHGNERLDDRPTDSKDRLRIAHLHVPPHEEVEQFPVLPQLGELGRDARQRPRLMTTGRLSGVSGGREGAISMMDDNAVNSRSGARRCEEEAPFRIA